MNQELKHIIESLLFVTDAPLSIAGIKKILDLEDTDAVRSAVGQLEQEYESRKGGFYLCEVAGGYQLRTRPEYREWIQRMLQTTPARLSKPALETLAIIAYKQPVIRSDVEYIRGVDCGGVIRMLLERRLIKILGRKEIPGRPLVYGTTKRFLEIFGLKNLKDLPMPREFERSEESPAPSENGPVPPDDISPLNAALLPMIVDWDRLLPSVIPE
jgi:segregation and condensation protein B